MAYLGGKAQIGKELHDIILKIAHRKGYYGQPYFEPFIGYAGVMRHFSDYPGKLIGSDANQDLILNLKALQKGWHPPTHITEEQYKRLKYSKKHSAIRGYVGVNFAYRGDWFSGFSQGYREVSKANISMKIGRMIKGVHLTSGSYSKFHPRGMIIYCDPPYEGTSGYRAVGTFDSNKFWNTMRKWSKHNLVFISEEHAPSDFKVVWSKIKHRAILSGKTRSSIFKRENLYMYKY